MRDVGALPVRHLPDGLIRAGFDLAAIEGEFHALAHRITPSLQTVAIVARIERSEIRDHPVPPATSLPGFADAQPGLLHRYQLPSGFFSSSGKYFSTLTSGFGAAWPSPQIDASRIAVANSPSSASFHGPAAISFTAFSVPARQGVHWPQLSSSKNFIRLRATAFMSSWSDRITTACDPTKQPYGSKVPKSSGKSAMLAGNIPPAAPPRR